MLASAAVLAALACAGCGAGAGVAARGASFSWLVPAAAPPGWRVERISTGAALYYPPGWRRASGDRGTASAVLTGSGGQIRGYLNLTPRQGSETLADWASFRPRHNAQEGDRDVRSEGAAVELRFRDGRGSCVRDRYATVTAAQYVELACLVRGSHATSVIVAAASATAWHSLAPVLERAISAFST